MFLGVRSAHTETSFELLDFHAAAASFPPSIGADAKRSQINNVISRLVKDTFITAIIIVRKQICISICLLQRIQRTMGRCGRGK